MPAPVTPAPKPAPNREVKPPSELLLRVARFSKPIAGKPPAVRVAAGLLAINTLLLAGGVWAYLILRPPPTDSVEGYDFAASSLPMPPVEKEPAPKAHASSEGHVEATKTTKSKTPAKTEKKGADKKPAEKKTSEKKGAPKEPAKAEEHE
jgi:hypothetical protein